MTDTKDKTPPVSPPVTFHPDVAGESGEPPCQWFMKGKKFCDKIKKTVRCEGNVSRCPF